MTRKLITGGPITIERDNAEIEVEVDLHWIWEEGEEGSNSIPASWTLDYIQAYDSSEDFFLTLDEQDRAIGLYPAK